MTVHMFRCFIGRGKMSVSDLGTRIDDWVAANPEWTDDSVNHTLSERNTTLDGTGTTYYAVDVRFTEDDTKDNLTQKLGDKLKDKVAWYRLAYHSCPHDGTTRPIEETKTLSPDTSVELDYAPILDTITIGNGGYTAGEDYEITGRTLNIPSTSSITADTYTVSYGTKQCDWDSQTDWTAKDVTIPTGVSSPL